MRLPSRCAKSSAYRCRPKSAGIMSRTSPPCGRRYPSRRSVRNGKPGARWVWTKRWIMLWDRSPRDAAWGAWELQAVHGSSVENDDVPAIYKFFYNFFDRQEGIVRLRHELYFRLTGTNAGAGRNGSLTVPCAPPEDT